MNRDTNTFISGLSQAARDNPLAAALIGGGALWLMFGNRPITGAASGIASVVEPLAERSMRGMSSAAEAVTNAGSRATDAVMDTARTATRAAGEAATSGTSAIKDRWDQTFDRTTESMGRTADNLNRAGQETVRSIPNPMPELQRGYASVQSTLSDLLERQPLVLGAIGVAIGAGVASALARTALEDEWAGSYSDDVKDAVKSRAEQVAETAQRAAGEVGSEFRAAAGEAAGKLRKATENAAQTVRETADAGREF